MSYYIVSRETGERRVNTPFASLDDLITSLGGTLQADDFFSEECCMPEWQDDDDDTDDLSPTVEQDMDLLATYSQLNITELTATDRFHRSDTGALEQVCMEEDRLHRKRRA